MDKRKKPPKAKVDAGGDSSGDTNIKVVVRCRPMNATERHKRQAEVVQFDGSHKSLVIHNRKRMNKAKTRQFTFDAVYDPQATQAEIYDSSVTSMVDHLLQGFNVTIFAYGQTGTGKTFTMEGNHSEHGILQKAFRQIFAFTDRQRRHRCVVQCAYLELYQGKARDLLNGSRTTPLDAKSRPTLPCRGQRSVLCRSFDEIEKCRRQGYKRRITASTCFNDYSSRSHAIFTITLTLESLKTSKTLAHSKLHLVDLAGSECLQNSNASDLRLKECCDINLSLLAVNKVITSTMKGQGYIPYRDSLLTQLLQDSFGGDAKTLMIATISPAESNYNETLTTLEYANRAKRIKNAPVNAHRAKAEHGEDLAEKYRETLEALENSRKKLEAMQTLQEEMNTKTIRFMKDTVEFVDHLGGIPVAANPERRVSETDEDEVLKRKNERKNRKDFHHQFNL